MASAGNHNNDNEGDPLHESLRPPSPAISEDIATFTQTERMPAMDTELTTSPIEQSSAIALDVLGARREGSPIQEEKDDNDEEEATDIVSKM